MATVKFEQLTMTGEQFYEMQEMITTLEAEKVIAEKHAKRFTDFVEKLAKVTNLNLGELAEVLNADVDYDIRVSMSTSDKPSIRFAPRR